LPRRGSPLAAKVAVGRHVGDRLEELTALGFVEDWKKWHEQRRISVTGPYAVLALVGTFWIEDATTVPEVPGIWSVENDIVTVKSRSADGLVVDGEIVDGVAHPRSDLDPRPSTISHGDWKLALIKRAGKYAVRVYDPHARARASFLGIDTFSPDEKWSRPATFVGYDTDRLVKVPNADGYDRDLALSGEVTFTVDGEEHTLRVSARETGLHAVFSDQTNGRDTFGFRFIQLPPPRGDGSTVLDFNRAYLPPCAFTDHYLCPFPPEGNTLPFAVTAGEKAVRRRS
jgi:uncharacterized protein (DUF1684 family)